MRGDGTTMGWSDEVIEKARADPAGLEVVRGDCLGLWSDGNWVALIVVQPA